MASAKGESVKRLACVLLLAVLTSLVAGYRVSASSEVTWTVRSINLMTGNRYWYDSMSGQSRELLYAVSYPLGTVAAVDSGTVTYWTVEEVSVPPVMVKMWVSGSTAVGALDADGYSVGDIAVVAEP